MSFFTDFVKSINKTLRRETVSEKAAIVESRIVDYLKPSIANFQHVESFGSNFYRSEILTDNAMKKLISDAKRKGLSSRGGLFDVMAMAAQNSITLLTGIQDKGDKVLPKTLVVEGMTVPSATILKLVSSIDLFVEYSSRLMYQLAQHEASSDYQATTADKRYLSQHKGSYIDIISLLLDKPERLLADITSIEPVLVEDSTSVKASREVVRLNFIPLVTPVFRRIGIARVNWETEREERLRLEKRGIESAIERHRQASMGNYDARAEQVTENWRRELVLVNKKIAKMESDEGVA